MSTRSRAIFQVLALLNVNLGSLSARRGTSLMILVSTAGAVAVLISMLAMVEGLLSVASSTGRADRVLVLSEGANAEIRSSLSSGTVARIASSPGIVTDGDGQPLVSNEVVALGELTVDGSRLGRLPMRGISAAGVRMRSELEIVEGRRFEPGLRELIVGRMAAAQLPSLQVGRRVRVRDSEWLIVGIFGSGGSLQESELVTDADTLRTTFGRSQYQSVTIQLRSADDYDVFRRSLEDDASMSVTAQRESDHYAEQGRTVRRVLTFVAYFVGTAMAIGATLAAINAMYTTVRRRQREIATFRAIGFGNVAILTSVLMEAVVLAAVGGALGVLLATVVVDGTVASTVRDGASQLMFRLTITPEVAVIGLTWACCVGVLGGLLPAIRAVRIPAAAALRMA